MPFAIIVLITGICSFSANSVRALDALFRIAECPARITGRFAWKSRPAASSRLSILAISRFGLWCFKGWRPTSLSTGIAAILQGRSMWQAPGFSLSAYLKAMRTTSFTVSGFTTCLLRFVIGVNIVTRSRYWWDVRCIRSVPTWPVMAISGAPSVLASATPVTRLVAPGPKVARHTPAFPFNLP